MRPLFVMPFWWWLIAAGVRGARPFSLRNLVARSALVFVGGEVIAAGWLWATGGRHDALALALPFAERATALAAMLISAAPLFLVVRDSVRDGVFRSSALRETSIGFRVWLGAVIAAGALGLAPRIPPLHHLLLEADAQSGNYGPLRFLVGATIVAAPIVLAGVALALALDGRGFAGRRPLVRQPQSEVTYIPPPPRSEKIPGRPRIVSTTVDGVRTDRTENGRRPPR